MANVKEKGTWNKISKPFDGYSCSICHTKFPKSIFQTDAFNEFGSTIESFDSCPQCKSPMVGVQE